MAAFLASATRWQQSITCCKNPNWPGEGVVVGVRTRLRTGVRGRGKVDR